jgi:hypothetical protein
VETVYIHDLSIFNRQESCQLYKKEKLLHERKVYSEKILTRKIVRGRD